jgi:arylsulfatase A-like enzyme
MRYVSLVRVSVARSLALTASLGLFLTALASDPPPNIVFILADDLGYGDVHCYNSQSKIPTPNLDSLAQQGIRFTDAHASDSVCTPSRYSLLTGRYAFRSRLKAGVLRPWAAPLIERSRLTVPALLQQNGYATACIGKWHLGWDWPTTNGLPPESTNGIGNVDFSKPISGGPIEHGFDYYFGVDVPNYPPYCFIENDRTVGLPSIAAPLQKWVLTHPGPMVPGWNVTNLLPELTARAIDYLDNATNSAKPFFLYFSLTAPHLPVVPTADFHGTSRAGVYGDFVAQVDDTVGQVVAALARTGLETNTLVIFTSDNGPECVDMNPAAYERILRYDHWSMGELRGVKRDVWEGGHRVPFLARWPNHIPAGAVSGEVVCHVDLMATCAALAGTNLTSTAGEDSYNILPALLSQQAATPLREATVLRSGNGKFAIRQGDWMLITASSGDGNAGVNRGSEPAWFKALRGYTTNSYAGELYLLSEDIAQRHNWYGAKPAIVTHLKSLLTQYEINGRSTPGPRLSTSAQTPVAGETNSIPSE